MKVLIINQHTLNFGDDIAGISLIQNLLKYDNLEKIDIIYNTKGKLLIDNEKIFHNQHIMLKNIGYFNLIKYFLFRKIGIKKFKNAALDDLLRIIDEADYIFVSPCGANIGIYRDWRFLTKLLIVVNEKKTPIFYLNTIGSSNSKIFDFFAKRVLKRSKIYVREKKSLEYIESLGLEAKFGVDTAFSFENTFTDKIERKEEYIAFIPTILKSWHPNFKNIDIDRRVFEEIIPTIAMFAKSQEMKIKLVPHLKSEEEDNYYKKIKNKLEEFNVKVEYLENINTVYQYNNAILSANFVIGMRYHSIVLAIKNCVPFVSLSYENKMQEVCAYSNMKQYSIKLYTKDFDSKQLEMILNNARKNSETTKKKLEKILNEKLIPLSKIPLEEIKD